MPDRGIWTLECQACGKHFTVQVAPGEQLVEFVKTSVCPHCHRSPDEHITGDKALALGIA